MYQKFLNFLHIMFQSVRSCFKLPSLSRGLKKPTLCPPQRRMCSTAAAEPQKEVPVHDQLKTGPFQKVGNVIIIELNSHLWQQPWEISRALRQLNFEFRGQVTVHPDIPEVRERLFHCRNLVNIDIVPIDEMKRLLCIPSHITFSDLLSQFPETWGEHPSAVFEYTVALKKFAQYRKERIRDIMHRDAVEMRLVRLRRQMKASNEPRRE